MSKNENTRSEKKNTPICSCCCGGFTSDKDAGKVGENIKAKVRKRYASIVSTRNHLQSSCCGNMGNTLTPDSISKNIGYDGKDLSDMPEEANLGLGCGNPTALASVKEGETVLDLGSGAGIDCFLIANRIGKNGQVIGVDMTPQMIEKARKLAKDQGFANIDFRLGEIENLPVESGTVDLIISNCVINLIPDKPKAFSEAFRVLKPGGKIMISDIVVAKELPLEIRESVLAYVGCVAGADLKTEYLSKIKYAGFSEITIANEKHFPIEETIKSPEVDKIKEKIQKHLGVEAIDDIAKSILSVTVSAVKPL